MTVFIAGDTGVPLGNRMQAFVLMEDGHPNLVGPGKRPRTTLTPTVVLRNGRPWLALSSPGGDSQEQQALQVLLNIVLFGMSPQEAIEAPRFNSLHYHESFRTHRFTSGVLEVEDRIPPGVVDAPVRILEPLDGFVSADRDQIVQVLTNLVQNGLDAASAVRDDPRVVVTIGPLPNDRVRIVVRDNGPGIDPERRERVFEPYETSRKSGTGLGLGLSGARRLSNEFQIESKPGEGTRVTIARWR